MSVIATQLLAVHEALDSKRIPHAFGGAIALAYCTHEPRGTRDIDVNVFVGPHRSEEVFRALPKGISVPSGSDGAVDDHGQVRLFWDETPLDVFFSVHPFHGRAEKSLRSVPFEGTHIPVLDCESLIVFKAMFNRTRDWADIEEILSAGQVDRNKVSAFLQELLGVDDPVCVRFARLA